MIIDVIKGSLLPPEDYIFGVADLRGLLEKKYDKYPFGISVGKRLNNNIVNNITSGPTLEYYHHYKHTNRELSAVAHCIKSELHKMKIETMVIEPTVDTEVKKFEHYLKTLTVEVSHKMVATRAGLGWIGKTDLLISKAFGPRLRLVSLLINNYPDHDSKPIEKSRCGNCSICVEKCPAGAANGKLWNIKVHRNLFFDAHKCRKTCGELAMKRLNVNVRICGMCVAVCPIGSTK